ncbi:MAG: hypothetical protein ACLT3H_02760 [Roseburia sp.]
MTFKDIIKKDVADIFLNFDEFGEKHTIDGRMLTVIVDSYEQIQREKRYKALEDGIHTKQVLFYVSAADFGKLPMQGRIMRYDNADYRVTDAVREGGVYSISLEAARS